MTEVICLFAFLLDCFYRCCWFLPLEFSNFDLGLKGSIFFPVHYMRTMAVPVWWNLLVLPSPTLAHGIKYEMWLPLVLPFFVYFFHAPFVVFFYFMWIFRVFPAMSTSLINGAREWLLDAIKTRYPNLEEESRFRGFSYNFYSRRKIVWHPSKYLLLENKGSRTRVEE